MEKIFIEIDKLQHEINAHRPFSTEELEQIKEYFRIGLTYTSNALEGNSLTEAETKVVLENGLTVGGKPLIDHLEALGHSDAYNYLFELIKKSEITEEDIKQLHKLFYYRIDESHAGIYRTTRAFITGSKYPLPLPGQLPNLMQTMMVNLHEKRSHMHPVEFAAYAHKELVFIHPFIDGNGRVARLLMNLLLMQAKYSVAIIPPIVRKDYIYSLERAHIDDHDFIMFIASMVKETQRDYLRLFL